MWKAILALALSAFAVSCAPKPLKVLPEAPKQAKFPTPPKALLEEPGCVLRPISFCEEPKTKNDTTN